MKFTDKQREVILEEIFDLPHYREAVIAMLDEGISAYKAEDRYGVPRNAGSKQLKRYKAHVEYLERVINAGSELIMSIDSISEEFEKSSTEELSNLILSLRESSSVNDIFYGASQWFSLQRSGHVTDKAEELFNELSGFVSGVGMTPDSVVTVYRGCSDVDYLERGFSWTLDKNVASWFATRATGSPVVARMQISSSRCIGLVSGSEREVLIHPESIEEFELVEFDESDKPSLRKWLGKF